MSPTHTHPKQSKSYFKIKFYFEFFVTVVVGDFFYFSFLVIIKLNNGKTIQNKKYAVIETDMINASISSSMSGQF